MRLERRRQILLAALVVVLSVVFYRGWGALSRPTAADAPRRTPGAAPAPARRATPPPADNPDVQLDALDAERPKPGATDRNLFRFKVKAPPPPPPRSPDVPRAPIPAAPAVPAG